MKSAIEVPKADTFALEILLHTHFNPSFRVVTKNIPIAPFQLSLGYLKNQYMLTIQSLAVKRLTPFSRHPFCRIC